MNPVLAGLCGCCPICGRGPLFDGFLKVAPSCAACGADFALADSGDGPAVFIILIVGFLPCFGMLFSDLALHLPIWPALLIWLPAAGAASVGLMRPPKGLMVAAQFHNNASEARRGRL